LRILVPFVGNGRARSDSAALAPPDEEPSRGFKANNPIAITRGASRGHRSAHGGRFKIDPDCVRALQGNSVPMLWVAMKNPPLSMISYRLFFIRARMRARDRLGQARALRQNSCLHKCEMAWESARVNLDAH